MPHHAVPNSSPRVVILQCREVHDPMANHELECIQKKFQKTAAHVTVHNTLAQPPPDALLDNDAIIVGGSGDFSVHDPRSQEWVNPTCHFLERVLKHNMPGFGICFGHQLLGRVLGAEVVTSCDHTEIGTIELDLTEEGRADPVFGGLQRKFRAQTGHSDHVSSVPHGVTLMATGALLNTQAFQVDGTRFYSTQFHPDLTGAQARQRYLAYHHKLASVNPLAAIQGAERFALDHDDACLLLGHFIDEVVLHLKRL